MRIDRTKNTARNLIWGIVNKVLGLVVPFLCRGAIIRIFGMNYLGLGTLFTSILTALNLAELGFGSAIVYFMYQATADDDTRLICSLMKYYKKVYRIIGCFVLVAGLAIMPLIPFLIKKDVPSDINVYTVYLLSLAGTAITYFLCAYKNSLLTAFQRNDISSKISSIVLLLERLLQLFCIIFLQNYYLYLAVTIFMNAALNIITALWVNKLYPQYRAEGNLSSSERSLIKNKITGLFWYKVGNMVLGSGDTIIVSTFLGLTVAGIYGNYYYVTSTLLSFYTIYYISFRAGLGNSIAVESIAQNFNLFKILQFIQTWLIGWSTVCLLCLFQDFMVLYAGNNNLFSMGLVFVICINFFVWRIQDIVSVFKEASGLWDTDKYRPMIGAIVNLILNCILVQYIGVYGIVFATIFVLTIIDIPWSSKVLFNEYFKESRNEYYRLLLNAVFNLVIMALPTYAICLMINLHNVFLSLVIKSIICCIVPNAIFIVINRNKKEFIETRNRIGFLLKR